MILEEIHASGCNAGACHAQMYIMGTLLRHGSADAEADAICRRSPSGELRLQAFGVTEPTTGSRHDEAQDAAPRRSGDEYVVQRPEGLDLARAAFRPDAAAGAHHAGRAGEARGDGLSVFLVDIRASRGKGLEIRPLQAMINHNTTEMFFDDWKCRRRT